MILYFSVSKIGVLNLPSIKLMTVLIVAGSVVTANNKIQFALWHNRAAKHDGKTIDIVSIMMITKDCPLCCGWWREVDHCYNKHKHCVSAWTMVQFSSGRGYWVPAEIKCSNLQRRSLKITTDQGRLLEITRNY